MQTQCSIPDCAGIVVARTWCDTHYRRWKRTGDPLVVRKARSKWPDEEVRFWSHVDPCRTDGCALWLGGRTSDGYGVLRFGGKGGLAHHFLVGRPPKGLEWDHVKERGCTHRNCVWPAHLELVTHAENIRRGDYSATRTQFVEGRQKVIGTRRTPLTLADVAFIRSNPCTSTQARIDLGAIVGVSGCTIWRVQTGRTLAHVVT